MIRWVWIGLMMAGLAACSSVSTRSDHDPAADFSDYLSYAWVTDALMVQPRAATDPTLSSLVQQRIRDAVDRTLAAKGFTKVADSADFVVAYTVGLRDRVRVDHWGPYGGAYRIFGGYGGGFGRRGGVGAGVGYGRTTATSYTEGTLAVDIFDGQSQRPVWSGSATKIVNERDQQPQEIQGIVDRILSDFPPRRASR